MPPLKNARHEAFAQGLAKGLSADEAYQAAGYSANRGNAIRLKANENVRKRVDDLVGRGAKRAEVTVERVLEGLWKEATREGEGSSHSARVSAYTALGKHLEMFTDKVKGDVDARLTVEVVRFGEDQAPGE